MIRNPLREQTHVRVFVRPRALVPAPPDDPFPLRGRLRAFLDPRDRFGLSRHADEIDALERSAELGKVDMRIDQAG